MQKRCLAYIAMMAFAFMGILAIAKLEGETNMLTGSFASLPFNINPLLPLIFVVLFMAVLIVYVCKRSR
jgi:hypothetical protein